MHCKPRRRSPCAAASQILLQSIPVITQDGGFVSLRYYFSVFRCAEKTAGGKYIHQNFSVTRRKVFRGASMEVSSPEKSALFCIFLRTSAQSMERGRPAGHRRHAAGLRAPVHPRKPFLCSLNDRTASLSAPVSRIAGEITAKKPLTKEIAKPCTWSVLPM